MAGGCGVVTPGAPALRRPAPTAVVASASSSSSRDVALVRDTGIRGSTIGAGP